MTSRKTKPSTYLDRLLMELDEIHTSYTKVLAASAIVNVDPNRHGSRHMVFVGYPTWGWATSDPAMEASRMALLRRVHDWEPRFRLLFPHPTPTVSKRLDQHTGRLQGWLVGRERNNGVPATLDKTAEMIDTHVAELRAVADLLPKDEYAVRLTVDTNTLIDDPDLVVHPAAIGRRHMAHLLPVEPAVALGGVHGGRRFKRIDKREGTGRRARWPRRTRSVATEPVSEVR
jgi:hypothetical protein